MHKQNTNLDGRFQTVLTACGDLNVSRNTLMRIAAEANAIVRFGRPVRIDIVYDTLELPKKSVRIP